jgi:hypothetical protein
MRTAKLASCLCVVLLAAAGCATARYTHWTPTGGTLVLEGDPEKADREATRLMTQHCPAGYQLLGDRERLIGTEEERLRQTRLRYECKPAAMPAPAADAPPPPS